MEIESVQGRTKDGRVEGKIFQLEVPKAEITEITNRRFEEMFCLDAKRTTVGEFCIFSKASI